MNIKKIIKLTELLEMNKNLPKRFDIFNRPIEDDNLIIIGNFLPRNRFNRASG
jgi:hypothetical protein